MHESEMCITLPNSHEIVSYMKEGDIIYAQVDNFKQAVGRIVRIEPARHNRTAFFLVPIR